MIDYDGLKTIFGDKLPEPNVFFATVAANAIVPNYSTLRKELGLSPARTNRAVWKKFEKAFAESGPSVIKVQSVSVDPKSVSVTTDSQRVLTATITPPDATNKTVTFTSQDPTKATIQSQSGLTCTVLTKAELGPVNIIVTTQDGNKTDTCVVTVIAQ